MADLAADLMCRADELAGERRNPEGEWQDVADVISPRRGDFTRTTSTGQRPTRDILDSTGRQAHRFLAAALNSLLTSGRWFALRVDDWRAMQDRDSRVWLERLTEIAYQVFTSPAGNFVGNIDELYLDLTGYGSAGMLIRNEPGMMATPVLFTSRPLRELYFGENAEGRVNEVFRRFQMPAREAVAKWKDAAGETANKLAAEAKTAAQKVDFIHACSPRYGANVGKPGNKNMPHSSVMLAVPDKAVVYESGYQSCPWVTPRWGKVNGSAYGEGCGMVALPDLNMLQRMMRVTIRSAEKMIDPALLIPDDGITGPLRTGPSKTNVVRADLMMGRESPVRAMPTDGHPEIGEEMMQSARDRVRAAFFYQLLQVMQDPKMTATQVLQLAEEVRRILGPVFGRLETELLGPALDRVITILLQIPGLLPPMPARLSGRKLHFEYVSPLARAMRASEAEAIMRTLDAVRILAQSDPAVVDNYDLDLIARKLGDILGVPADVQRAIEVVQQMREARQQVADAQHTAQLAEQGANTVATIAKVMPGPGGPGAKADA